MQEPKSTQTSHWGILYVRRKGNQSLGTLECVRRGGSWTSGTRMENVVLLLKEQGLSSASVSVSHKRSIGSATPAAT